MNQFLRKLFLSTLLFFPLFFFSCVSTPVEIQPLDSQQLLPEHFIWESISEEIQICNVSNDEERLYYHLVKIDLTSPRLDLVSFPSSEKDIKNGYFKSPGLKNFVKKSPSLIAVNASPFSSTLSGWFSVLTSKRANVGILKVNGEVLYPPAPRYDAIIFTKKDESLHADFISQKDTESLSQADWAFGGYWIMVKDGKILDYPEHIFNGRTAFGLSFDKKTLYILQVEKRGRGLSFPECGRILIFAGATEGMQMDGGPFSGLSVGGDFNHHYGQYFKCGSSLGFRLKKMISIDD